MFDLSVNQVSQDYSGKVQGRNIVLMQQSFHLWQKSLKTVFIEDTKSLVILNKDGLGVICICDLDRRVVVNEENKQFIIHSLESFNYLKVDKGNFI